MRTWLFSLLILSVQPMLWAQSPTEKKQLINFKDIHTPELIRYLSRICNVGFVYDEDDLDFLITIQSTQALTSEALLKAFFISLKNKGYEARWENGVYVITKYQEPKPETPKPLELVFAIHKLKYHKGDDIEASVKKLIEQHSDENLHKAAQTLQWIKSTNSLVFSADEKTKHKLLDLIASLDVPLRQVFIEVLVVETDVRKSHEFGLDWGATGKVNGASISGGSMHPGSNLYGALEKQNPLKAFSLNGGFDLGVIGDILLHKGRIHLSLGSLVSALETDKAAHIVLNQKIITQDSKNSTIFVGDNIPFTGSIIQTNGQSQQTTANIEYRDVGVKLSITPMLGEDEIITLDINQEITESLEDFRGLSANQVGGIRTTKTNMVTHVHVPNKNFLVLSGMIRNARAQARSQVPCLGGLPAIAAAFSHDLKRNEKKNILIFVRPLIIASQEDYEKVTAPLEKEIESKF
jgi:type III secretion protein C